MNERSLFVAALRQPDVQSREAFLIEACGDNAALRENVEALLREHNELGSFLEAPAADIEATAAASNVPAERPGTVIGRYKLMEQIGEGGMGLVFIAEQHHPVRRKVALKLIKPGMDSRQVIARFEAERQALALMDHPNIARVIDGGTTESGRPYFVMELVRGVPITEYCDENRLTTRARLDLFLQVCAAVQHAHQKGIIHRDIKPSNVMVVSHDGTPVVKVIDFGIAKAMGQQLTDKTIYTQFVQFVGTPAYMSPEQAGQSGLDIDTRTDVYALGVLLYELLTGTTPFDKDRLKDASYDEIRRIIRDEEPPRPSTRVSTLDAQAGSTVSARRQSEPKQLSVQLRGELDWIVMKALEKDRTRRYESASALAADVARYLKDEPVQACPPSRRYLLGKYLRRHRTGLVMAATVSAATLMIAVSALSIAMDRRTKKTEQDQAVSAAWSEAERCEKVGNWSDAATAAKRAIDLIGEQPGDDAMRDRIQKRLEIFSLLLAIVDTRLESAFVEEKVGDIRPVTFLDQQYAVAFREHGLDADTLDPAELARRIPDGPTRHELAGALDDWAFQRRESRARAKLPDNAPWQRILNAARAVDLNPANNRLRDLWADNTGAAKKEAATISWDGMHPYSLRIVLAMVPVNDRTRVLREFQSRNRNDFWTNYELGWQLYFQGIALNAGPHGSASMEEASGFLRLALSISKDNPRVRFLLGQSLTYFNRSEQVVEEGLDHLRSAAAARQHPTFYSVLGDKLANHDRLDEAAAAVRTSIRLRPGIGSITQHWMLGDILGRNKLWDEAEKAYDEALLFSLQSQMKAPDTTMPYLGAVQHILQGNRDSVWPELCAKLGLIRFQQGSFAESSELLRIAVDEMSRKKPDGRAAIAAIKNQIKRSDHFQKLEQRLPLVIAGSKANSASELVELAQFSRRFKRAYAQAAHLYEKAFETDPKLASIDENCYFAAGVAVLAGCRRGAGAADVNDEQQGRLLRMAREWLEQERLNCESLLSAGLASRRAASLERLSRWQTDPDLAGVRDPKLLAQLSPEEAASWRQFWNSLPKISDTRTRGELTNQKRRIDHVVPLTSGKTYLVDLESMTFDAHLILFDQNNKLAMQNDDIDTGVYLKMERAEWDVRDAYDLFSARFRLQNVREEFNARLVVCPTANGNFTIRVKDLTNELIGPYTLRVRAISEAPGGSDSSENN